MDKVKKDKRFYVLLLTAVIDLLGIGILNSVGHPEDVCHETGHNC